MPLRKTKELYRKGTTFLIKLLPAIMTVVLVLQSNATACSINGQPTPPKSIKKYRKF